MNLSIIILEVSSTPLPCARRFGLDGPLPAAASRHLGDRLRLFVLTSGIMDWHIPELGKRRIEAGSWCLLSDYGPPSEWVAREPVEGCAVEMTLADLSGPAEAPAVLPEKLGCLRCPGRSSAFFESGLCDGRLRRLARRLCAEQDPADAAALWARCADTASLVARILKAPEFRKECACHSGLCPRDLVTLEAVAAHLARNLDATHSTAGLARRFHLNEFKLKKAFKQHFGLPLFAYLRRKRMEAAWPLIADEGFSVMEAALAVGYSNASHFARAFREVHGLNPRELKDALTRSR